MFYDKSKGPRDGIIEIRLGLFVVAAIGGFAGMHFV